jgi:hypothetical protein
LPTYTLSMCTSPVEGVMAGKDMEATFNLQLSNS